MTLSYFECRPTELCEGARCCTSNETQPALIVFDYLRLSESTGKPIGDIWREKGSICFTPLSSTAELGAVLGLLHDPCPYLDADYHCSVYEKRPLGCTDFPFILLNKRSAQVGTAYNDYDCLQGVCLSSKQRSFSENMLRLYRDCTQMELELFWNNDPPVFQIPTTTEIAQLLIDAEKKQRARDPRGMNERTRIFSAAYTQSVGILEQLSVGIPVNPNTLTATLSHIVYALLEDDIAERLETLDEQLIAFYERNKRKFARTLRKHP